MSDNHECMMKLNPINDVATARMLLELCVETGADEPIGEVPVNRFHLPTPAKNRAAMNQKREVAQVAKSPPRQKEEPQKGVDINEKAAAIAKHQAAGCQSLEQLKKTVAAYPHCDLRGFAQNLVFSDGDPGARVMLVGEAPGADEDRQGKPFVGSSGKLLDRMFAAIGLRRDHQDPVHALYITNVIPWRPPGNRNPSKIEIAMMSPFVERHVELVKPKILVAVGNFSCAVFVGETGITRLRGNWFVWRSIPVLPLFHPAYLLRGPGRKADSWHDMLLIQKKLRELG